jgi:hypothetical protein
MADGIQLVVATACFGGQVSSIYTTSLVKLQIALRSYADIKFKLEMQRNDALITRAGRPREPPQPRRPDDLRRQPRHSVRRCRILGGLSLSFRLIERPPHPNLLPEGRGSITRTLLLPRPNGERVAEP